MKYNKKVNERSSVIIMIKQFILKKLQGNGYLI